MSEAQPNAPEPGRPPLRRGPLLLLAAASAFGAVLGASMTRMYELRQYGPPDLVVELVGCVERSRIRCDAMDGDTFAELMGVPQFTWAAATYATLALLGVAGVAGRREVLRPIAAVVAFAALYSVLLLWIAVTATGRLCAACLVLHLLNVVLAGLVAWAGAHRAPLPDPRAPVTAAGVWALITLGAVAAQQTYRGGLAGDAPAPAPERPNLYAQAAPARHWATPTADGRPWTVNVQPDDPWRGARDGAVIVLTFDDPTDPASARLARDLEPLAAAYADRVLFVAKHLPSGPGCAPAAVDALPCEAARIGVCANAQGRYWEWRREVARNGHALRGGALRGYARAAGLDLDALDACLASGGPGRVLRADLAAAASLGVTGPPWIVVGEATFGPEVHAVQLAAHLDALLRSPEPRARDILASLTPPREDPPAVARDLPPMRAIGDGDGAFRIDTFEAKLRGATASVGRGEVASTRVDWFAARDACAASGKRLCTEAEWVTACQGAPVVDDDRDGAVADDRIEGTTWPYGDRYDPRACWEGKSDAFRPTFTGESPRCRSRDGVFDLVGNLEEWAGATPEEAVLLGGAWDTPKGRATCYRRNDTFGPRYASARTGFRCCAEPAQPTLDLPGEVEGGSWDGYPYLVPETAR